MIIPLQRYFMRIFLFLLVIGGLTFLLIKEISAFFQANLMLNSLIVFVFFMGLLYNLQQLTKLSTEARWLKAFYNQEDLPEKQLHLLRPLQNFHSEHQEDFTLDAPSSQFILDNIDARLEETRDLSRYVIALLVFLGLLGTFWGLLITTASFSEIFQNSADMGTEADALSGLLAKLQLPLSGMKTAFATSLFGLSASLILGFVDLQRAQGQNQFVTAVEEALVKLTSLNKSSSESYFSTSQQQASADKLDLLVAAMEKNNQLLQSLLKSQQSHHIELAARHNSIMENIKYHNDIMHFLAQEVQKMESFQTSNQNMFQQFSKLLEKNPEAPEDAGQDE